MAENGQSIEVAVQPHLVTELLRRWPPLGLAQRREPTGEVLLSRGLSNEWINIPDRDVSGDSPPVEAWDQLEQTMTAFAVQRLSRLVAVHAAAIAWRGRLLIGPAASGSGKSTLAMAAIDAGAEVLSDEYVLIDTVTALATGWRRPVEVMGDHGSWTRHDVTVASNPLPVGAIAVVTYSDAGENRWVPMTKAETVVELLTHCVTAPLRPQESMDAALEVAGSAVTVRGIRGEAAGAIQQLLSLIS